MGDDAEHANAIALLEATHRFPVEYDVSIIARNLAGVLDDVRAAVERGLSAALPDDAYRMVPSTGGRYASHRFRVPCAAAEDVLALYARIRQVKGVVTVL